MAHVELKALHCASLPIPNRFQCEALGRRWGGCRGTGLDKIAQTALNGGGRVEEFCRGRSGTAAKIGFQ